MNFEQEVIARSEQVPVVVDFWAPWCGPCQFLGPVIEALAEEAQGQWELVKVNTDEDQEVSMTYGIRGIPAVKMFYRGKIIAEFTGALSKPQLQKWLKDHLPDEGKEQLKAFIPQLFTNQHAETTQQLEQFVEAHPDMEEGQLLLAAASVGQHPERAREAVQDAHKNFELGEDIRSLADLMTCSEEGSPKVMEQIQQAQLALKENRFETALQALIQATMLDKTFCQELPRRATVALFRLMDVDHPLTKKYRKQFDMALY
ncbi:MAG: thioredoxin [Cyclobacteriaceae bacterium]